jgi:hypothetical protein
MIQHEFGFFKKTEDDFRKFLAVLTKPVVIAFHTVLPGPTIFKAHVQQISAIAESLIVMTHSSRVLINDYGVPPKKLQSSAWHTLCSIRTKSPEGQT